MKTRMKTMLMSLLICSACCAQHIETRPSFPGGYKALQEFIEKEKKYPDEALKKREEGAYRSLLERGDLLLPSTHLVM